MGKEILPFGDVEIEKNKFYYYKRFAPLKEVDIEKILRWTLIYVFSRDWLKSCSLER